MILKRKELIKTKKGEKPHQRKIPFPRAKIDVALNLPIANYTKHRQTDRARNTGNAFQLCL
jgi:hypothetical protein